MTGEQVDERVYKGALAAWTSGICILTAAADDQRAGLTVSSFCSVSLRPPTVLASVERQGHTHELVVASQAFTINLLRVEQRVLGERFAGLHGDIDRFASADWRPGAGDRRAAACGRTGLVGMPPVAAARGG